MLHQNRKMCRICSVFRRSFHCFSNCSPNTKKNEKRKKPELLLEFECICAAERGQRGRGNAHTELDVVFAYSLLVLIRIVQRRLGLCTLTIYSVFICNEFMFEQWKLFGRVRACAVCGCFLPARNHIVDSCMEIFETKT